MLALTSVAAAASLALNFVLIPRLGIFGAATVCLLSELIVLGGTILFSYRGLRVTHLTSLAMAATIRTLVNRPQVVKIRGALGPERYARVLAYPAAPSQSAPATAAGDLDMVERLVRCGAAEFAGFADSAHPAWGESVRLTYERAWWFDACAPSLAPAAAEACLRLRIQQPVSATNPRVNPSVSPGVNPGAKPVAGLRPGSAGETH